MQQAGERNQRDCGEDGGFEQHDADCMVTLDDLHRPFTGWMSPKKREEHERVERVGLFRCA